MSALKLVAEDKNIDLRGVLTDEDLKTLQKRNEERAAAAKTKLGRNWTCHPVNRTVKKTETNILEQHRKKHG